MKKNMNKDLRAVDCCGMRVRKDKGPSAERNLLPRMPDRKGHDTEWGQGQSGRSMVEMLGVLAIVGVLSVGAIGGYSYAMNKHRTNELIYEATKRAQWVGTQLEMNNSNPSINTFGTDSFGGGRFTGEVVQLENGQIGIKVADLKEAVCENIKNEIGDNTVIREMRDVNCNDDNGTATLVFNRDLGTSDSENGGGQGGNEPEGPEETTLDCGVHGEQSGNACVCDFEYTGDDCTTRKTDDQKCNGHGYIDVYSDGCRCNSGYYGADCSETEVQSCDENSDCDPGYFCRYDSTHLNCETGPTAEGTCAKVSVYRGGHNNGYVKSRVELDWFSAENFCAANGKEMLALSDINCPYTAEQYRLHGGGFCCPTAGDSINQSCPGGHGALADMGIGSTWTKDLRDSCHAFVVQNYGSVDSSDRKNSSSVTCQ